MTKEDILNKFSLHKVKPSEIDTMDDIRWTIMHLAFDINASMDDCREKSLAITKLEECPMWVNKGITIDEERV